MTELEKSSEIVTIERFTTVKNKFGMHVRPCAILAKIASMFDTCEIIIEKDASKKGENKGASAKSLMGLLALQVSRGDKIKIIVKGPESDIVEAIKEIIKLVDDEFGYGDLA